MTPPPEHEGASGAPGKSNPRTVAMILGGVGCGLLIICGVLGVAVLIPVFAQARESAWTTGCASNLKRISTASLIYAADNNDRLPPSPWMDAIRNDVRGSERTYHCPKVRSQQNGGFGYAFSCLTIGKRTPEFDVPSQQVMILDSSKLERNAVSDPSLLPSPARHQRGKVRGNNVVYLDGHTSLVEFPQVD